MGPKQFRLDNTVKQHNQHKNHKAINFGFNATCYFVPLSCLIIYFMAERREKLNNEHCSDHSGQFHAGHSGNWTSV